MPLNTFSNEEEQRFLADGIAEDIITQLARNSELTVMPRTASFSFKDKGLSATEIASKLTCIISLKAVFAVSANNYGSPLS